MTSDTVSEAALLDLSALPRHAQGPRSPLWWATVLLVAIESTSFALIFVSYFYLRNNFDEWPPDERLRLAPGAATLAALLLTLLPTWLYRRAACAEKFAAMRFWLVVSTLLALAAIALRCWEIGAVPFSWTANAHASLVWMSLGMHTLEIASGAVESAFLCLVLYRARVETKSFEDVEASALFWFFSVLVWVPFAAAFYWEGLSH
jgi:heme/copper-type cytochrome/quinol oxidase subunit 3